MIENDGSKVYHEKWKKIQQLKVKVLSITNQCHQPIAHYKLTYNKTSNLLIQEIKKIFEKKSKVG
jgi:hypothetical protein